jgi:hypothetical protein
MDRPLYLKLKDGKFGAWAQYRLATYRGPRITRTGSKHPPEVIELGYSPGYGLGPSFDSSCIANNCVPLDTTILTRRGYLAFDQVLRGDETLGLDDSGSLVWTRINEIYESGTKMPLLHAANSRWETTTTPNHRWWAERECGYKRSVGWVREDATTENLTHESRRRIRVAGTLKASSRVDISHQEAALIGWLYTDGYIAWAEPGRTRAPTQAKPLKLTVRIAQSRNKFYRQLRDLIHSLGLDYHEEVRDAENASVFYLRPRQVRPILRRAELVDDVGVPTGTLSNFVLKLGTEELAAFVHAAQLAEGDQSDQLRTLYQNKGAVAEALELAVFLSGSAPHVRTHKDRPRALEITACAPTVARVSHLESAQPAEVWCVNTTVGTWTMRQHGQLMVTGNSGFWALNLAYCLGCDPIILFGYDLNPVNGKQGWWHPGYGSDPSASPYNKMRQHIEGISPELKAAGRRIWNCSPGSSISTIEIVDTIDEVLARLAADKLEKAKRVGADIANL